MGGLILAASLPLAGCNNAGRVSDHPVVGPAPPRIAAAGEARTATLDENPPSGIVAASFDSGTSDDWTDVAARVDGLPIFVSDVLERERVGLEQFRQRVDPDVFRRQRDELIIKQLATHIEQHLILEAVRADLSEEQMTSVSEQLDALFGDEIERLKGVLKVASTAELEKALLEQGTSISALQRSFENKQLAGQYLGLKLQKIEPPTRTQILSRYQQRIDDYTKPADVRWQQIWISYEANGGRDAALAKLHLAVADLKSGETFDVVVSRHSDGAMKDVGGVWDYARQSSIADEAVREALFSLPPGEVSPPLDTGRAFQLVRVIDRRPQRTVPFAEVQDELARAIGDERRRGLITQTVQELWDQAEIRTPYDDDPRWLAVLEGRRESAIAAAAGTPPPR